MIPVADIQRIVAQYYGIPKADFLGQKRVLQIARPRQIAMYLARELTQRSLPNIGRRFGRDHTTILFAWRQIKGLMEVVESVAADVTILRERITNYAALRELDTLAMRVYSAQIQQAKWDDAAFVAIAPEAISAPPEPSKPAKRVRLNAYGARRPEPAERGEVDLSAFDPRNPIPSAFPRRAA